MKILTSLILSFILICLWSCSDNGKNPVSSECTLDLDCAGECGGSAVVDVCGTCGGSITDTTQCVCLEGEVEDCTGECGGSAVVDVCGICSGSETDENNCLGIYNDIAVAKQFHIERLYPNPFNPTVTIEYEISQLAYISGKIFNLKGQLIETVFSEYKSIGSYNLIWNASLYPSGIYLFILENNSELLIKKMILLK